MKRIYLIILIVAIILLIPAIAMQFTTEVNWTIGDFIVAGVLLLGTGLSIDLVIRNAKSTEAKIGFSVLLFLALVLVWAELAVGVFGTPFAGS